MIETTKGTRNSKVTSLIRFVGFEYFVVNELNRKGMS